MQVKPIKRNIFFQFASDTRDGVFLPKNSGVIITTAKNYENQGTTPRWVKITHIGPEVTQLQVGDYALVEPLKWTQKFKLDDDQFYWKSEEDFVIATTTDEKVTYDF